MKRILLTILAFFYLGVSSGATVHLHYCMGELVKWSLTTPDEGNCELCGMTKNATKKNSCCKDDYKQAKVDQSKKATQLVYEFKQFPAVFQHTFNSDAHQIALSALKTNTVFSNAPPERLSVPVFIRNCTYRI
ncbi:HYC_CC_PP family protein [Pedobacter suwonensis]|uniref:HYC_CC_PP family protein n=1 Tax=Pedobacter suwonensis TaxID=332999 RepID=UPI0036BF38C2